MIIVLKKNIFLNIQNIIHDKNSYCNKSRFVDLCYFQLVPGRTYVTHRVYQFSENYAGKTIRCQGYYTDSSSKCSYRLVLVIFPRYSIIGIIQTIFLMVGATHRTGNEIQLSGRRALPAKEYKISVLNFTMTGLLSFRITTALEVKL